MRKVLTEGSRKFGNMYFFFPLICSVLFVIFFFILLLNVSIISCHTSFHRFVIIFMAVSRCMQLKINFGCPLLIRNLYVDYSMGVVFTLVPLRFRCLMKVTNFRKKSKSPFKVLVLVRLFWLPLSQRAAGAS